MNDCPCQGPGYCERHKVTKSPHWWKLCRDRGKYWVAWEEGRGMGQRGPREPSTVVKQIGPGTELRKILGCSCRCQEKKFLWTMNRLGPDGCLEHIDEIAAWISKHGDNGRETINSESATRLAMLAIKRSRITVKSE